MGVTDSDVFALSDAAGQMNAAGSQPGIQGTPRFDPEVAHLARVYGYWLGCKDHYRADRQAAEEVIRQRPQAVAGALANRAFLARAVRYLAAQRGVRQFLDIGAGLPAPGNTHEVAQAVAPESRVVYVDNDPVVLSHARALLASTPEGSCDCIDADLRIPDVIVREAARILDFSRPVAVLLVAVLHFLPGIDDPQGIVKSLAGALAPGSFVVVSHLTGDFAPGQVASGVATYNSLVSAGITARSHAEVTALFGDLSLVPPGVVPVSEWRPDLRDLSHHADIYAGLATIQRRPW
jgi:SAM-dependent methyltransferase